MGSVDGVGGEVGRPQRQGPNYVLADLLVVSVSVPVSVYLVGWFGSVVSFYGFDPFSRFFFCCSPLFDLSFWFLVFGFSAVYFCCNLFFI